MNNKDELLLQVDGACDSDGEETVLPQVDGVDDHGDGEQLEEGEEHEQQEQQPEQEQMQEQPQEQEMQQEPEPQQEELQQPHEGDGDHAAMVTTAAVATAEGGDVVNQEASLEQPEAGDAAVTAVTDASPMTTDPTAFLQMHDEAPQVTLAHMDAAVTMATEAAITTAPILSALTTEAEAMLALGDVDTKPSEVAPPSSEPAPTEETTEAGMKMEDDSEKLAGIVPMMDVSGPASTGMIVSSLVYCN